MKDLTKCFQKLQCCLCFLFNSKALRKGWLKKNAHSWYSVTLKIFLISTVSENGTAMVPMPCAYWMMEKYCTIALTETRQESSPYQMEKDLTPCGRSVKFVSRGYLSSHFHITDQGNVVLFCLVTIAFGWNQRYFAGYFVMCFQHCVVSVHEANTC